MSNLETYLTRHNHWRDILGMTALTLDSPEDRQALANSIEADLSPENLTCDGELSGNDVRLRYSFLVRCASELLTLDSGINLGEILKCNTE